MNLMYRFADKPTTSSPGVLDHLLEGDWLCQFKYDGWRCLVTWDGDLSFHSRERKPLDVSPAIRAELRAMLKGAPPLLLDGEWAKMRHAARDETLHLFDLLGVDNVWKGALAAATRYDMLKAFIRKGDGVRIVESRTSGYRKMFEESMQRPETEGVVLKRRGSFIVGSARGCADNPQWLKCKWRDGPDGHRIVASVRSPDEHISHPVGALV